MFNTAYAILKNKGFVYFCKLISLRLAIRFISLPIAFCIIFISPFIRIRLFKLFSSRIGHYAFNTEAMLCALEKEPAGRKKNKVFFYTLPGETICNEQLHKMWQRVITILPFAYLAADVDKLLKRYAGKNYRNDPIKKNFEPDGDGRDRWRLVDKNKFCHLNFTAEEHKQGQTQLNELGVPKGVPFVCLLVRDSSYLKNYMPDADWSYHDYRDAEIKNYLLAAEYLAAKGYYVIRMGKVVKEPFVSHHPQIIDYATTRLRSDFLDVYLSAHCAFFISTCTGLDSIARIFRKPFLVTNLGLPDFDIWHPWDIFIPKKIQNLTDGTILSFRQMHDLYFSIAQKPKINDLLMTKKLSFVDNKPEEIRDAVMEMEQIVTRTIVYSEADNILQQKFWQCFPKHLSINHLPVLKLPLHDKIDMRIGNEFLKKNKQLLLESYSST